MGAAVGVGIATQALGSILGASDSIQQGNAQAAQDRQNAAFSGMAAADAYQRGARNVGLVRSRGSQVIGQQKVGYAASGVDVASGTPADTMASTRAMSELDAAAARNNAAREAFGYKVQQNNYLNDANAAQQRGYMGAVGSILGGIGGIAGRYGDKMDDYFSKPKKPGRGGPAGPAFDTGAGDYASSDGGSGRGYA